jgi:hypothetical protein
MTSVSPIEKGYPIGILAFAVIFPDSPQGDHNRATEIKNDPRELGRSSRGSGHKGEFVPLYLLEV